jgi:hypothetical protein
MSSEPSRIADLFLHDSRKINTTASSMPVAAALAPKAALFSVGGEVHAEGRCKPCAFFHKEGGCQNGVACIFCHHCPPFEKQRRKRLRRRMLRQMPQNAARHFPAFTKSDTLADGDDWGGEPWSQGNGDRHVVGHEVFRLLAAASWQNNAMPGATVSRRAGDHPGMHLARASVLSTAPPSNSSRRRGQDDAAYGMFRPAQMPYHPGAVQYALVPVPVPMQQPLPLSPQHQTQHNGGMSTMARPSWHDLSQNQMFGERYNDMHAAQQQWLPYLCTEDSLGNGSYSD